MKPLAIIAGLLVTLSPLQAPAMEKGLAAPAGAENFFAGAFPPPGFYFQANFFYYSANRVRGGLPGTQVESFITMPRLVYSSNIKVLGANWGCAVTVFLTYLGVRSKPAHFSDYGHGLGGIALTPIILGYHFGEFHVTPGFNVFVPGSYDPNHFANPTQGYFTFQPGLGLAWLPKWGLGANILMAYDFPTNNTDPLKFLGSRHYYQSGQAFQFDYCLDYAVLPRLRLGATGYYYVQTTPDIQDGRNVGRHARAFSLGPGIKYDYHKWSFIFVNQWEMAVKNLSEGRTFWFKGWYTF